MTKKTKINGLIGLIFATGVAAGTAQNLDNINTGYCAHCAQCPATAEQPAVDTPVTEEYQEIKVTCGDDYKYTSENGKITIREYFGHPDTVVIPNSIQGLPVTRIHNLGWDCGLTAITLPRTLEYLDPNAFPPTLETVHVDPANPSFTEYGGVVFDKTKTHAIFCPQAKTGNYILPAETTEIQTNAFANSELISITIPNATIIGEGAFQYSKRLKQVTIKSSPSIGNYAFAYCPVLTSASFTNTPPTMGAQVFNNASPEFTVYYYNDAGGFTNPQWEGYTSVHVNNTNETNIWLTKNDLLSDTNLLVDDNQDGVNLLTEYAYNLPANQTNPDLLPKTEVSPTQLSITFYAGRSNIVYTAEASMDNENWTTNDVELSDPDRCGNRTATISADKAKYMRIVVSQ